MSSRERSSRFSDIMFICSILLLVCSTAVAQRSDKSILYSRTSISILLISLLLVYNSTYLYFLDKGISLFNGLLHETAITASFHIFIIIITCFILQLTSFYPRKIWLNNYGSLWSQINQKIAIYNSLILNKFSEQYRILEYSLIILFVVTGGAFLISSSDLISIFLSIELQSYGLYILCTTYRNSERATSGGLTYFLLGALSSCFILLGSALLYGNSGNTAFDSIFIINSISNSDLSMNNWYLSTYLVFSLIIFSVGFLFKISAAPFHFWSPDVYDAIPTVVTTFVAVFTKITILVLFLELVHYTCGGMSNFYDTLITPNDINTSVYIDDMSDHMDNYNKNSNSILVEWTFIFIISSLLSLIIGSILGLTQFRIKRLYAYSTISHLGFILLALTINSLESIQSFIFYLTQYSLANLNAFFILIAIGYSLFIYTYIPHAKQIEDKDGFAILDLVETNKEERNNSPIQLVKEIKGYFEINPTLAISLTITLFSFVGIPPLVGFFAKQMVLSAALDSGYIFITFVAILTSVVSAYYYLAIVKQIFFYNSDYVINPQLKDVTFKGYITNIENIKQVNTSNSNIHNITYSINNVSLSSFLSVSISILTLIMLLFILSPQEWLSLGSILSLIIFNN